MRDRERQSKGGQNEGGPIKLAHERDEIEKISRKAFAAAAGKGVSGSARKFDSTL